MDFESMRALISSNDLEDHKRVLEHLRELATGDRALAVVLGRALLEAHDEGLRSDACWAAERSGLTELIPEIIELAQADESWIVRADAVEALGELGGADAMSAIRQVSLDVDPIVRGYAALAAGIAGSAEDDLWLADWLRREDDSGARNELLSARARLGDSESLGLLADSIVSEEDDVGSSGLLTILHDLMDRRTPPYLPLHAPRLIAALRERCNSEQLSENGRPQVHRAPGGHPCSEHDAWSRPKRSSLSARKPVWRSFLVDRFSSK